MKRRSGLIAKDFVTNDEAVFLPFQLWLKTH
jgi:hypothetical protein